MKKRTKTTVRETPALQIAADNKPKPDEPAVVSVEKPKPSFNRPVLEAHSTHAKPIDLSGCDKFVVVKPEDEDISKSQGWQKQTFVMDQQLGICKDFAVTGYCTFGWSCKFLHIRDRVYSSFELDRKNELAELEKAREEMKQVDIVSLHICPICKQKYVNPVILKCGHIFCDKCAMHRFKDSKTCYTCGKDTEGIFNTYKPEKEAEKKVEHSSEDEKKKKA